MSVPRPPQPRARARTHRAIPLAAWCLLTSWLLSFSPISVSAENRVTAGGNYYRERSTRVLQPYVSFSVDAPDERLSLGAAYLLDSISSASIASGTMAATGGDNVFHEFRHELAVNAGSKLGPWQLGTYFRYSTETDYAGRGIGLSAARDFLQRTLNLSFSYQFGFDRVYRIVNNLGVRQPWCGGAVGPQDCVKTGTGVGSNFLQIHTFAWGYTHVLARTLLAQFGVIYGHVRGPQDNPYRKELIINGFPETHPRIRNRVTLSPSLRWAIPKARLVFEPMYGFYVDDWGIRGHTPELRIHARVARHVRLRARYRYYHQTGAYFWRTDGVYQHTPGACTRANETACTTADVKMMQWDSHTPGVALTWEFDGIAKHRGLHWLAGGWIEANYNHAFQNNRFGNARIGNITLSLAF